MFGRINKHPSLNKDLTRKLQSIRRPVRSGKSGTDEFDHADYSSVKPTKVAVKVDAGRDTGSNDFFKQSRVGIFQ